MYLNSHGLAALGVGNGVVSYGDGSQPQTTEITRPGATGGWFDDDTLFIAQGDQLLLYTIPTHTWTVVAPHGANAIAADGGVWAAWLDGFGLFSSVGLNDPDAGLVTVGPDGAIAYKAQYQSAGPILIHENDGGSIWTLPAGDPYDIQLLGQRRSVWREGRAANHDVRTYGLPTPVVRAANLWGPQIVELPSGPWIFYFSEGDGFAGAIFHPLTNPTQGFVVATGGALHSMKAVPLSDSLVKFAWCARPGELPDDLRVRVIDISAPLEDLTDLGGSAEIVPCDRPMWTGFFTGGPRAGGGWTTIASPHSVPGNCYLAVQQGVVREVTDSVAADPEAMTLVTGSSVEAIEQAAVAYENPLVYWDGLHWPRWPAVPPDGRICVRAYWNLHEFPTLAAFEAGIRDICASAPAGTKLALVCQCYTSNADQTTDLQALVPVYARLRRDCRNVDTVLVFSGTGRATGLQDHPEARPLWEEFYRTVPGHPPVEQEPDMKQPKVTMTNPMPVFSTTQPQQIEITDSENKQKVIFGTEWRDGKLSYFAKWMAEGFETVRTGIVRPVVLDCGGGGGVGTIPPAPSNLQATGSAAPSVKLSWHDNAADETSQRIERCKGADCSTFELLDEVGPNVTSYTDLNVSADQTYRYRVIAVNDYGKSAPSNVAIGKTGGTPVEMEKYTLRRHDIGEKISADDQKYLTATETGGVFEYDKGTHTLKLDGLFCSAENDGRVRADRVEAFDPQETWFEEANSDGTVSYRSKKSKLLISVHDDRTVRHDAKTAGGWENLKKEAAATGVTNRLQGQVRYEGRQPMDATGPRRPYGYVSFLGMRTLRVDPDAYYRHRDQVAKAGYQIERRLINVGGNAAWTGYEVVGVGYTNSNGVWVPAWDNYEEILRKDILACKERGIYLYLCTGDSFCYRHNPDEELELHRIASRVAADTWPEGIFGIEGNNEYGLMGSNWGNSIYGDHDPEQLNQHQAIWSIWRAAIPGVPFFRGSLNDEEPEMLNRSSSIGSGCGLHGMRRPVDGAMERASTLAYWGEMQGHFKPGNPTGWNFSEPGGCYGPGQDPRLVYNSWDNAADMCAVYSMLTLVGGTLFHFNASSLKGDEDPDKGPGFYNMPKILSHVAEDISSWRIETNAAARGILYRTSGNRFMTSTWEGWPNTPPREIAEWQMYGLSPDGNQILEESGTGTPRTLNPGERGRLIVGTFA